MISIVGVIYYVPASFGILSSSWRFVCDALIEQKCSDGIRGLAHRVVGGREVVHLPLRIGLKSGAEFSEGRVAPAGAVNELAPRDLSRLAGEPDRLQQRREWMRAPSGIAAVRRVDGVAGSRGTIDERLPILLSRRRPARLAITGWWSQLPPTAPVGPP
jgi:hypothetical protein